MVMPSKHIPLSHCAATIQHSTVPKYPQESDLKMYRRLCVLKPALKNQVFHKLLREIHNSLVSTSLLRYSRGRFPVAYLPRVASQIQMLTVY